MLNLLIQFSYLQMLDFLTTLAFLTNGVEEANPVVRFFLNVAPSPLSGLVAVKVIGLGLGVYCWQRGRRRLLGRVNFFYAALVAWNLVALLAASGGNGA
jgi:hypothetical protein